MVEGYLTTYTPTQQHAGDFLRGFSWRLYCTGTFRRQPWDESEALLRLKRSISALRRAMRFGRRQVAFYAALDSKYSGLGNSGVRKHWHFLLACPDHPLLEHVFEQLWFAEHGFTRFIRYCPEDAAAYYINKLIPDGVFQYFEGLEHLTYSGPSDLIEAARQNPYVPERLKNKVFGKFLVLRRHQAELCEGPLKPDSKKASNDKL
jgi:hypothetical protein